MATTMEVLARLSADASQFKREFGSAERAVKGLEDETTSSSGRIGAVLGGLGRIGVAAFTAIGAGATAAAGWGLKVAMDTETAQVGFETLMGSTERANAFLKDLAGFAAATPFEFPELRESASRLMAVGTNASDVIPIMTRLGDATSAMGTGSEGISRAVTALTQMQQKGKATGEEMLQLAEAGIPAWDALAASLGMSVAETQKLVSEGKVSADQVFSAIESGAGDAMKKVSGMMEAQSQTLSGLMSSLKDNVQMALGDMMGPAVESIKGSLPAFTSAITDAMNAVGPQISVLATGLVDVLGALLPTIAPLLGSVAGLIGGTFTALKPIIEKLAPVFPDLAEAVGALAEAFMPLIVMLADDFADVLIIAAEGLKDLANFLKDNRGIIKALAPVVVAATAAFLAFKGAMEVVSIIKQVRGAVVALNGAFAANPVVLVVAGIAALVAGLIYAYKHFEGFRKVVDSVWQFLQQVWDWITGFFVTVWDGIVAAWKAVWDAIKGVVSAVWDAIKAVVMTYINLVIGYYKLLWEAWKLVWDGIKAAFDAVWAGIKAVIDGWINIFKTIFETIKSVWRTAWDGIKTVFSTVWDSIKGAIDTGVATMKRIWETLTAPFRAVWDGIKSSISSGIDAIKGMVTSLRDHFSNIFDKIKGIVGGVFNGVGAALKGVVNVMLSTIESGLNFLIGGLNRALDAIDKAAGPWINFGTIPRVTLPRLMAEGGLVTGSTVAMVGEAGREAVLPLTNPRAMTDIAQAITRRMPAGGGIGSPNIYIEINGAGGEPRAIEEAVRSGIDQAFRQLTRELAVI